MFFGHERFFMTRKKIDDINKIYSYNILTHFIIRMNQVYIYNINMIYSDVAIIVVLKFIDLTQMCKQRI